MRARLVFVLCLVTAGCTQESDPLNPGGLDGSSPDIEGSDSGEFDADSPDVDQRFDGGGPEDTGEPDGAGLSDVGFIPCRGDQDFCTLRDGMVGRWMGNAVTANGQRYQVIIEFQSDGVYVATCVRDTDCSIPFYYGEPGPAPGQTYALSDLTAGGLGTADIGIAFSGNARPNLGELQQIDLFDGGRQLSFRFRPTWTTTRFYVEYELTRL